MHSRRAFLKWFGLTGLAAAALGGGAAAITRAGQGDAGAAGHGGAADITPSGGSSSSPSLTVEQMDAAHEQSMKQFPARTRGRGLQPLEPEVRDGVKVFRLTARPGKWETSPGHEVDLFLFNDQFPGPLIRVQEGDRVRVVVQNELPESTSVHWHGLRVPNAMDGVTYLNQKPIKPGESFTYEFTVRNAGTHTYHSHHNSAVQVSKGLVGPFVVDAKDSARHYGADREAFLFLMDGTAGLTINGKSFPATEPIVARKNERVRLRILNLGAMAHPMHLHGMTMEIVEKDGNPLRVPYECDTINVAPGERYDAIVVANELGVWALHCHILPHAESEHGMFGMTTVFIVEG